MSCRVLLVEDHDDLARLMSAMLESIGFAVVGPVASVEEARRAIETGDFHVALVDQGLPDGPGTVVVRELLDRDIPCGVLSGFHRDPEIDRGLEDVPWLLKPVDPDSLQAALEKLCAAAREGARES